MSVTIPSFLRICAPRTAALLFACACLTACPSDPGPEDMAVGSDAGTDAGAFPIVAITLSPGDTTLERGATRAFTATGVGADASQRDLTSQVAWSVRDVQGAGVSSIDAAGVATGTGVGTAAVTASFRGLTATASLRVTAPLSVLSISPARPTLALSTTQQLTATALFADASTKDVTGEVGWSSTDVTGSNVAPISASGLATATTAGEAVVTATYLGKTALTLIKVTSASLSTLAVTPATPKAAKGLELQFRATGTFSDASQQDLTAQATWTSTDVTGIGVAPITRTGRSTAQSAGTASITASLLGKTGTTSITVIDATVSSLAITPAAPAINKTGTRQLTATVTYADGSTQDVTASAVWQATDLSGTGVASVSATGLATGLNGGTATLTARYGGKSASVTFTVSGSTQPPPVITAISPATSPSAGGATLTLRGSGFDDLDIVTVGAKLSEQVVFRSATELSVKVPAALGTLGLVPVTVTHSDGQRDTRSDLFAYYASTLNFGPFTNATAPPGLYRAATGDWNGDGKLDLAAVGATSNTLTVMLGNGAGGFGVPTTVAAGMSPVGIVTGDVNGNQACTYSGALCARRKVREKRKSTLHAVMSRLPMSGRL